MVHFCLTLLTSFARSARHTSPLALSGIVSSAVSVAVLCGIAQAQGSNEPMRLGWQVPWAVQGQLVMGLDKGGLAQDAGLDIEYIGFTYGAPLNQAALSGEVDILLTADQPAVALLYRSDNYRIVSRMMYNRVCLYVPPKSEIADVSGLNGKLIAGPLGAAAERVAASALDGLTVRYSQMDMSAQTALLKSQGTEASEWSGIDGLFGFDPLPAFFEDEGLAKILVCKPVVSVVLASTDMIENRRDDLSSFLQAFAKSWIWYANDPVTANRDFVAAAKLDFTDDQLDLAASLEPNFKASNLKDLRLTLNEADQAALLSARDFLAGQGAVAADFDPRTKIDLSVLNEALAD